ncbi:MAG TPA: c-type cytochrome [Accumulibacter sp.]|uniref:c-type cytochrome n=3 Tax=Accumulibacter sp. TaxID=2053492 RepID=UPI00262B74D3|nr:c-type cytochrome [Accumulibacter sp.]HMW62317.1 c-type cytochrome [Accumulibacter sp.]HMW78803.1 c-type cytochrome [Accumulibacter sp.]HMX68196.1 c-type cytochrome [Accumulibacter sp.]HNC27363.1 c-type cytochrome [Accumulibacter sp.]HND37501.1 c-type cytochrome [Accumulibacter sp.]
MIRTTALAVLLAASIPAFATEQAKAKVDLAKAKEIAETVCVGCHGADGNSPAAANPIIAGQVREYLYKQLGNFKAADGKPALRTNPIMAGMVAALSDEDMHSLAAYFSQQAIKPSLARDEKLLAEGKALWRKGDFEKGIPACAGCHGPAGAGLPAQYPRLAGQYAEYTATQLKTFRTHERANDPEKMMRVIAGKLSDAQISAVAEYAAGLR